MPIRQNLCTLKYSIFIPINPIHTGRHKNYEINGLIIQLRFSSVSLGAMLAENEKMSFSGYFAILLNLVVFDRVFPSRCCTVLEVELRLKTRALTDLQ